MISAANLSESFPEVPVGIKPLGAHVIVQLRLTREKTSGGIVIPKQTREYNDSMAQFAKIVGVGPIAFCNRQTGLPWPEGVWAHVGDIVRVPRYGGDRMCRETPDGNVIFVVFDDYMVSACIDKDVLTSLDELL